MTTPYQRNNTKSDYLSIHHQANTTSTMLQVTERRFVSSRPRQTRAWQASHRYWRTYKRAYERKQRHLEYRRLQAIVPAVARRQRVSKVSICILLGIATGMA